ncbi:MAG: oxidoreductase [Rheinheimera sp.]|uniref:NAD(P)-binding oxidoreductase n=1 Tax=Arsukibacterium sp. UBA3155 TaxID=1946058 RepID=UPI000C91BDFF|nr:NAD(P)-binding oxidoreductase [Arsukibacterium sp. UBA3155]MAD74040.1 oxidoreductase [Rheinheimera sp.]|tara:strand:- start:104625 stop:105260 length:636 start_codon:yes stop_codon:yes gene_type:complete
MKQTLIIGASGQIGKMATILLLDAKQHVKALVRDKTKLSDITNERLAITEQNLEGEFGDAFAGCDQVIFVAGSGGDTGTDKTMLIDLWAAAKAARYAKAHQLQHFIMISSIGADDPEAVEGDMKPYIVAKHLADQQLINSGVPYTIIRPGRLTDDDASLKISTVRPEDNIKLKISRENVAHVLLHVATKAEPHNQIIEIFDGEQPIETVLN